MTDTSTAELAATGFSSHLLYRDSAGWGKANLTSHHEARDKEYNGTDRSCGSPPPPLYRVRKEWGVSVTCHQAPGGLHEQYRATQQFSEKGGDTILFTRLSSGHTKSGSL